MAGSQTLSARICSGAIPFSRDAESSERSAANTGSSAFRTIGPVSARGV